MFKIIRTQTYHNLLQSLESYKYHCRRSDEEIASLEAEIENYQDDNLPARNDKGQFVSRKDRK